MSFYISPLQMIATPNGMMPIKDLKSGDQIFGMDGLPHNVSKIICITQKKYEIEINDSIIPTVKL
jgi:hypothetical protein